MNKFQADEEVPMPVLRIDEQIEREQVARTCRQYVQNATPVSAENALNATQSAAQGTENLLPHILTAVESHITVGEISHALRKVWGEYRESVTI